MPPLSIKQKLKSLCLITLSSYGTFAAISLYREDEKFYRNCVMPIVHFLDAEKAHNLAVFISKHRLLPKSKYVDSDLLKVKMFGKEISNPIGIAAGFDKDGKAILGLQDMGFGFVEIGSVTPEPQDGNEKPRVFRLSSDLAVINRYGFNSEGHNQVLQRLENIRQNKAESIKSSIGVNLGKNKLSEDAIQDYVEGIKKFGLFADYLVINISSPNTPGLRSMQNKENLTNLLKPLIAARNELATNEKIPILLKLAPDLTYEERKNIADIIKQPNCRVDGLIVCNTTIERPSSLKSDEDLIKQTGGLSGEPLKDVSTKMIADMSKLTNGMFIIGVGGVRSGQDAYDKIKAGATLVQLYTVMIYDGPPIVGKIKKELSQLLILDGYKNVMEAVGKDLK